MVRPGVDQTTTAFELINFSTRGASGRMIKGEGHTHKARFEMISRFRNANLRARLITASCKLACICAHGLVAVLEGVSGLFNGELPVDFDAFLFSFFDQSEDFSFHLLDGWDAAMEALAG